MTDMFVAPAIDYTALLPMIIVFVAGLLGCLVEGFAPRGLRYAVQVPLAATLSAFAEDHAGNRSSIVELDLAAAKKHRAAFGFFRDRRPELYGRLVEDR